jgi:pimeloyl-ACP methyl ester carboxylesterase
MTQLVLLPGLATDAALWQAQLAVLPAVWRSIVTDVHTREATITTMAVRLLEEHPGPLVLCGASMGGMIALEAARLAPQRLRGLALLGTTAQPETPEMRAVREAAIELFAQGRLREVLQANVPLAFAPAQAGNASLVDAYIAMIERAGSDQLIAQNRAVITRPDARVHLHALPCPLLMICGAHDQLSPPEMAREIAALAPRAELVELADCGHMITMEQPDALNALLLDWLGRLP